MTIETEHRGYKITYGENEDVWRCWALEIEAPGLSTVKRKIDVIDRKRRAMAEPVRAYLLNDHQAPREVGVSLLAEAPNPNRSYEAAGKAWTLNDPSQSKGREKTSIDRLMPITPEAMAALEVFVAAKAAERAATAKAKAAYNAIPRLTYEALAALLPKDET